MCKDMCLFGFVTFFLLHSTKSVASHGYANDSTSTTYADESHIYESSTYIDPLVKDKQKSNWGQIKRYPSYKEFSILYTTIDVYYIYISWKCMYSYYSVHIGPSSSRWFVSKCLRSDWTINCIGTMYKAHTHTSTVYTKGFKLVPDTIAVFNFDGIFISSKENVCVFITYRIWEYIIIIYV